MDTRKRKSFNLHKRFFIFLLRRFNFFRLKFGKAPLVNVVGRRTTTLLNFIPCVGFTSTFHSVRSVKRVVTFIYLLCTCRHRTLYKKWVEKEMWRNYYFFLLLARLLGSLYKNTCCIFAVLQTYRDWRRIVVNNTEMFLLLDRLEGVSCSASTSRTLWENLGEGTCALVSIPRSFLWGNFWRETSESFVASSACFDDGS